MKSKNCILFEFQKYIFCATLFVLISFALSGCGTGSVVDTSLIINNDMSGSRIIDIHVEDEVFKNSNVSGNVDELKTIVAKYIPSCMSCEYTESTSIGKKSSGTKVTFSFVIDFISKEDYISKIKSLIGDNVSIDVEIPDNIWSSGIGFSESFSSRDLMKWLQDAIVAEGLVSQSNAGYIFGKGTNIVFFANETFEVDEHINVNTITKLQINDIDLLFDVNDIGHIDVTVIFKIPEATMNKRGADIRAYMDSMASNEIELAEDGANDIIFTLKSYNNNVNGINEILKQIFGNDNSQVTIISYDTSIFSTFQFIDYFNAKINYSEYTGTENTNTHTKVLVKCAEHIQVANDDDLSTIDYINSKDNDYKNYLAIADGYQNGWDLNLLFCKTLLMKRIDIKVKANQSGSKWQNDTLFYFENTPSDFEKKILIDRFNLLLENVYIDDKDKMELAVEINDSDMSAQYLSIMEKGSIDFLQNVSNMLFGADSCIYYANKKSYGLFNGFSFVHKIDFSKLIVNPSSQFGINYACDIKGKWEENNINDLRPVWDKNKMNVFIPGVVLDIETTGKYLNWISILCGAFIFAGGILLLYSLFFTNLFIGKNNEVHPNEGNKKQDNDRNSDLNSDLNKDENNDNGKKTGIFSLLKNNKKKTKDENDINEKNEDITNTDFKKSQNEDDVITLVAGLAEKNANDINAKENTKKTTVSLDRNIADAKSITDIKINSDEINLDAYNSKNTEVSDMEDGEGGSLHSDILKADTHNDESKNIELLNESAFSNQVLNKKEDNNKNTTNKSSEGKKEDDGYFHSMSDYDYFFDTDSIK